MLLRRHLLDCGARPTYRIWSGGYGFDHIFRRYIQIPTHLCLHLRVLPLNSNLYISTNWNTYLVPIRESYSLQNSIHRDRFTTLFQSPTNILIGTIPFHCRWPHSQFPFQNRIQPPFARSAVLLPLPPHPPPPAHSTGRGFRVARRQTTR